MQLTTTDNFDRPIRDLRISVTDRCNFRCSYCMPAEIFGEKYEFLSKNEILSFEEIVRLARLFVDLGVTKIRITGGEPLLRRELETLISKLSRIDGVMDLSLTTNGYLLARKALALKKAGMKRISVSLDSLDNDVFKKMNGGGFTVDRVLEGIWESEKVGFHPIKINVVVQRGVNDHNLVDLAKYFHGSGHVVRFIEYMDVGNRNKWELNQVVPANEILQRIHAKMPIEPISQNYRGEVARRYRYCDGGGEIGVITSVTMPFCGECTRARVSTDGKFYTCLFASQGNDLRIPLRRGANDFELRELIRGIWSRREDKYSEIRTFETPDARDLPKVEMYQIGG